MAKLRQCIGDPKADTPNPILDAEMNVQHGTEKVRHCGNSPGACS